MKPKTPHEPEEKLLPASEAAADVDEIAQLVFRPKPTIRLEVPLTALLEALDSLTHDDLEEFQRRIGERLAVSGVS